MDLGVHHSERTTNLNNLLRFIGRKITFFRRIRGVSQAELADEVSIEKEEIDAIEKGKKILLLQNYIKYHNS